MVGKEAIIDKINSSNGQIWVWDTRNCDAGGQVVNRRIGSKVCQDSSLESRSQKGRSIMNGPTILTLMRIVLVAPVMICIFMDSLPARIITIVCFVLASLTDFIDGRWARHDKIVTDLGAFLDPLADKMLVNLTFLALVVLNIVPVWMFGVILIRDFAVDGLRMMAARKRITLSASKFGKLKTMTQMITITLILINMIFGNEIFATINTILLYIVIILTIFSGLNYLYKGRKLVL